MSLPTDHVSGAGELKFENTEYADLFTDGDFQLRMATRLAADGELGGTRNLLPLTDASMFGAGQTPLQLRQMMRRLAARQRMQIATYMRP